MTAADSVDDDGAAYCARQVRALDPDRFVCTQFAPAPPRAAIMALLAFDIELAGVRERVSEPLIGQIRLQWWRDALDSIIAGTPPQQPVAAALARVIDAYRLEREPLERMIDAREFDLGEQPPDDLAALAAYAEATAGSLTASMLACLGCADNPAAIAAGREVALAWAFTGIARSVGVHAAARRVFLPATWLRESGLTPHDLFAGRKPDRAAEAAKRLAEAARAHLAAARRFTPDVPRRALPALLPAALAGLHLRALARNRYRPGPAVPLGLSRPIRLLWSAARGKY